MDITWMVRTGAESSARVAATVSFVASGLMTVAASRERWLPCGSWEAPACLQVQDHRYDYVVPSAPWTPIGHAAQYAAAALSPFGAHVTSGTLALSGRALHRSLTVALRDSDPGPGFLEVWLLDARTGGMVALGVLDGSRGSYDVPSGLDMAAYDQVDVSREAYDGNPAHAKESLARGQLP